ncbi:hypothetical protein IGI04_023106 [Brassica rapa subsp. trilocularis]|uniref:Uncharacterized protein n=1 Tax=Brassica rapa subsp. trilocularis TaxID=1813537 RepID=A0ABQ7LXR8_BRACM|nr:hypothetical protein IGI04_032032 [Brassica rapa subsp. trilocularis]KAG5393143.1 hypothetical protein IGI04_023106 [Brassica rapa subsp. trilocularis]
MDPNVIGSTSLNPKIVGDGSASTATKYGGVKKIVSLTLLLSCNYPLTNPNTCRLQSSCALRKLTALKKQMGGATSHNLNAPGNFSVVSHRLRRRSGRPREHSLPKCVKDIVVRNLTFQLKLSEFNFSGKQLFTKYSFTVSRIFCRNQRPPLPQHNEVMITLTMRCHELEL